MFSTMKKQKSLNSSYPEELKEIGGSILTLSWLKHIELDPEAELELSILKRATYLRKASETEHEHDCGKSKRKREQCDCRNSGNQNPLQERLQRSNSDRNHLIIKHPLEQKRPEIIGKCSRELSKRLTESDVRDRYQRLQLGKNEAHAVFDPVLSDEEKEGLKGNQEVQVIVYVEDGKEYEMCYKYWSNEKSIVFTKGWKALYLEQGLKARDDVYLRMFRHTSTHNLGVLFSSRRNHSASAFQRG